MVSGGFTSEEWPTANGAEYKTIKFARCGTEGKTEFFMGLKERVRLISLGCPKNLVDTEVMLGLLIADGYRIPDTEEEAEIIIVNTCSFIKEAKQESIETILELAELKRRGNCHLLVVAGCLPQRYQDTLMQELPEVDLFIGTGEFQKVVEILDRFKESTNPRKGYIGEPGFMYSDNTPRVNTSGRYSAYVKIAEGCSNSCSYCVIGKIRGKFRSRPRSSIVNEVRKLVEMGVKEINLIGQDTTLYGRDLNPPTDLEELLRDLARVDKVEWIRTL
ncbi:MAG: radical SAM protein, partial [Pseudomonadota bacterium]